MHPSLNTLKFVVFYEKSNRAIVPSCHRAIVPSCHRAIQSFKLLFVLLIAVTFASCQKEENEKVSCKLVVKENPYNFVGQEHNVQVGAILKKNSKLTYNEMYDVINFNISRLKSVSEDSALLSLDTTIFFLQKYENCSYLRLDSLFADGYINLTVKGKVIEMQSILSSQQSTDSIRVSILNWENGILNDFSLNESDKEIILVFASVAKYSFGFWTNMPKKKTDAPWWQVVLADAIGAAVGAGTEGAVGAVVLATMSSVGAYQTL